MGSRRWAKRRATKRGLRFSVIWVPDTVLPAHTNRVLRLPKRVPGSFVYRVHRNGVSCFIVCGFCPTNFQFSGFRSSRVLIRNRFPVSGNGFSVPQTKFPELKSVANSFPGCLKSMRCCKAGQRVSLSRHLKLDVVI